MMRIRYLLCLLGLLFFAYEVSGQVTFAQSAIAMETADAQGRVAIAITLAEMPGQKFVLEIPELFTSKIGKGEHFNYSKQFWNYRQDGADMKLSDEKYTYEIHLDKVISKNAIGLKWKITFKNNSEETLEDLISFNCWTMNSAPLFKDVSMKRTYVLDSAGNKITLATVRKTQGSGRRNMQYYPVAKSKVNLSESPWIRNWNVISTQGLTGKCISIISTDSKWLFENKVDGKVAFFFNNFEDDHGCVHASPLLAKKLLPGKTGSASGIFKFTKIKNK
ncbi:hypothetical protein [Pedobacter jamesrossensis]|uniref:Uncharacterized protein n=1 Tax=Pedobacter jamesrossensis TaxID=1908238 RepID=A0ABV8NQD9_9SPHI